jgi:hypothetical protein
MFVRMCLSACLCLLGGEIADAQVGIWKLGGSGLDWSQNDTTNAMIDFDAVPGAIQPIYIEAGQNIIQLVEGWRFRRLPRELGFVNGEWPRVWKWNNGTGAPTENGTFLVDGDSTTYNVPKAEEIEQQFFTIDLAVPVPADQFGFFTPSEGFRSNGKPLRKDAVPAFQISIQEENSEVFDQKSDCARVSSSSSSILSETCGVLSLETIIAEVSENFESDIRIEFPAQYVRFVRFARKLSILDEEDLNRCGTTVAGESSTNAQAVREGCLGQGNLATALKGTIGDFELFGEGAPKRVIYKTVITDLGPERNFGRLFFAATPMRMVDGVAQVAPDADAWIEIEARTGRDDDPNLYHEFTIIGGERVVSRDRYENELLDRFVRRCTLCDPEPRAPKPGLRASITYDDKNWSFWSSATTESGENLGLRSGSHVQLRATLQSRTTTDFMRLDSLWIETAPLLAAEVISEVARLDDPQPRRGFVEVELGETIDFVYDFRARFAEQLGFDAVRVRSGSRAQFRRLEMGEPIGAEERSAAVRFVEVAPAGIVEEADGLLVFLPEKVTRERNRPVRVVFGATVFEFATTFQGEVLSGDDLPQPVVPGDATQELSTNTLRVLGAAGSRPDFLQDLTLSTPVLTPNGDGVNDELEIRYALFRLPEQVPVTLEIYALDGRRVAALETGVQGSGTQSARWDGRDQDGNLLSPGVYLLAVAIRSEFAADKSLVPISVAY